MKIPEIVFCGVVALLALARGETDAQPSTVTVYIHSGSMNPTMRLACAEQIVSALFEIEGVHIEWRAGEPKGDHSNVTIVIEVTSGVPQASHPDVLASPSTRHDESTFDVQRSRTPETRNVYCLSAGTSI